MISETPIVFKILALFVLFGDPPEKNSLDLVLLPAEYPSYTYCEQVRLAMALERPYNKYKCLARHK